MQGDAVVIKALNEVLYLEIGFYEAVHGREHVFRRREYDYLVKWFDKAGDRSRKRRRYLQDRIFFFDSPAILGMALLTIRPGDSPVDMLSATLTEAIALLTSYQAAYQTAEQNGDNVTGHELCKLQDKLEDDIGDLEAFASQIDDQTIPTWLAGQM